MKSTKALIIKQGLADRHYWRDIWGYRELFYVLAWRDVAVRYKQTAIGLAWALLQPLITMIVFTVIFGKLAKLPSDGNVPYPLLVFAGLLPWSLFSMSFSGASASLVANSNLLSKIYFPRMIVPASAVVVAFVDFLLSFLILVLLMIWFDFLPSWQILTLPFFTVMALAASFGPGLWISSLNIKYRDFRYIVPFLIQLGMYASPVGFSSAIIPEKWRLLYSINPMVGVIDGFRWAILGEKSSIYLPGFLISWCGILFFLWLGVSQFRKMEKTFADMI